jgi:class 3 adenylate cyclase/pimeloyl-ACP methyl ester carboxylesterase
MMPVEPDIRYTRTDDGVSIAYTVLGNGPPLLITSPLGFSHIQLEFAYPPLAAWYEKLAKHVTLVCFDFRGTGLSERGLRDTPVDAGVRDITAVANATRFQQFALLGCGAPGFAACEFAASHPERLTALLLWFVPWDGAPGWGSTTVDAVRSLAEKNWRAFTDTLALAVLGWDNAATARNWAAFMRRATTMDDFRENAKFRTPATAAEALARITTDTLVLYPKGLRHLPESEAAKLAASIRGARLLLHAPIDPLGPTGDDSTTAILSFLGIAERNDDQQTHQPADTSRMAVILFVDIAGSTALTERVGDGAFRAMARELDARLRESMAGADGKVVEGKVMGDGVMAIFPSAAQAIEAAHACAALSADSELQLHIGIHAGDVISEGGNVYGGAVNIAARVCDASHPGEVLVTQTVRDLARTSTRVEFEDRGERDLKGVSEAVRLFAVSAS